jgi:glycosyltransferase involved in cell wall biosynthesis
LKIKGEKAMYISIVIPVYNRSAHLKNTLEALNHQLDFGINEYEVIVVDDGSDENTYSNIKGVNKSYNLKYLYLPRCSSSCVARARNFGWKVASGEVIAFIDSDIIVKEDFLKEIQRSYSSSKDMLVVGTRLMLDRDISFEEVSSRSIFEKYSNFMSDPELLEFRYKVFDDYSYNFRAIKYPWLLVFGFNMIIPKKWLEITGGYDENFMHWGQEDNELAYRLHCEDVKIVINSKLEVLHQFHGKAGNVEQVYFDGVIRNVDYLLSKHKNFLDMPKEMIYSLFKGELFVDYRLLREEPKHHMVHKVFSLEDVVSAKDSLLNLAEGDGYEVLVEDYLENSDLDIWIQSIESKTNVFKYYPASKKLVVCNKQEIS